MFAGYDADDPTREQAEIGWAAHGLSVVVVEEDRDGRQADGRIPAPPQPADHRHHAVRGHRPGGGQRAAADLRRPAGQARARHAEQLRRRHHPVGHRRCRGEENFNQYFANADEVTDPAARRA